MWHQVCLAVRDATGAWQYSQESCTAVGAEHAGVGQLGSSLGVSGNCLAGGKFEHLPVVNGRREGLVPCLLPAVDSSASLVALVHISQAGGPALQAQMLRQIGQGSMH